MRRKTREQFRQPALRSQRDVLRDVMLSAAQCGTWLTLRELSRLTRYGEASISAQLRHLRKPQYGAFVLEKRHREEEEVGRLAEQGAVWEYRLCRSARTATRRDWLSEPVIRGLVQVASRIQG
jgi:hypothetical protein